MALVTSLRPSVAGLGPGGKVADLVTREEVDGERRSPVSDGGGGGGP